MRPHRASKGRGEAGQHGDRPAARPAVSPRSYSAPSSGSPARAPRAYRSRIDPLGRRGRTAGQGQPGSPAAPAPCASRDSAPARHPAPAGSARTRVGVWRVPRRLLSIFDQQRLIPSVFQRVFKGSLIITWAITATTRPKRCIAKPDTAGLLRWEVWRAKPSKKHLVLGVVRAALPPEPGAKHKRLGGQWPPRPR